MILAMTSFSVAERTGKGEVMAITEETPARTINHRNTGPQEPAWIEATACCPCEKCCGKWALNRRTVSSTRQRAVARGVTIARLVRPPPVGTVIYMKDTEHEPSRIRRRCQVTRSTSISITWQALVFGRQMVLCISWRDKSPILNPEPIQTRRPPYLREQWRRTAGLQGLRAGPSS